MLIRLENLRNLYPLISLTFYFHLIVFYSCHAVGYPLQIQARNLTFNVLSALLSSYYLRNSLPKTYLVGIVFFTSLWSFTLPPICYFPFLGFLFACYRIVREVGFWNLTEHFVFITIVYISAVFSPLDKYVGLS